MYSARATKQNRTKGLNAGAQAPNALPYYGSDTISVADALKAVKDGFNDVLPLDVLNRLGEKRRITKDTPFLRYSIQAMDREYRQTVGEIEARAQEERGKWQQPDYRGAVALEDYFDVGRGQVRYSIQSMSDGTQYVEVDTDQDIFDGVPLEDYGRVIGRYMRDHFRGTQLTIAGNQIRVTRKGVGEYTGRRGYMTDDLYEAKERAGTVLDNMMQVATLIKDNVPDDGTHPEAVGGWGYYRVLFMAKGRMYEGTINVMNRQHDKVFYDIKPIRDITGASSANNRITTSNASTVSVQQNQPNVNDQTGQSGVRRSIDEADRAYMAAVERGIGTGKMAYVLFTVNHESRTVEELQVLYALRAKTEKKEGAAVAKPISQSGRDYAPSDVISIVDMLDAVKDKKRAGAVGQCPAHVQ